MVMGRRVESSGASSYTRHTAAWRHSSRRSDPENPSVSLASRHVSMHEEMLSSLENKEVINKIHSSCRRARGQHK